MIALLFSFGAILGSFLGVVSMRYNPEKLLADVHEISGRSRCMSCGTKLRWFELVPIVSYLIQRGRCRFCGKQVSFEHFAMEVLSGTIMAAVPYFVLHGGIYLQSGVFPSVFISALWVVAFLVLLVVSMIDLRHYLIPDEANFIIALTGIILAAFETWQPATSHLSFIGAYGYLFGPGYVPWLTAIIGMLGGALFFAAIVVFTRGKGMGMGDVKLAAALGLLFRFPDILILAGLAFVIGAIFATVALLRREKKFGSAMPLGPYLAIAAFVLFLFGEPLAHAYFSLIGG
ncbi:MAG: prepilin peptidase [Candidatus Liptonbacteria bacterium]